MDFSSASGELYGVAPGEFVETRTRLARRAKQDGDAALAKRIEALRRPTLPAWAVNLLARSAEDDLGRLLDVGEELRTAWGSGGGLGDLEQRRARLVRDLVRRAGELAADAGQPLRDQAVREVEDTLQAATVDAKVAGEVREGRLTQPRSHSGFVPAGFPVAPDGAEQERAERERPAKKKRPAAEAKVTRTSTARAKRAASLRKRAEEAAATLAERRQRAEEAREAAEQASTEVGRLRHELERAVTERDSAVRRAERAEQALARAQDAAHEARASAEEARKAADRDAEGG
ncbi:hypothetical protein [Actinomadura macra]|uniref:hypothetical protein n=1 Tax=Actinomadura macra TaxID=46164 RepID=UPI00082A51A4|nr:hypothetical protein [Actinomadura macra]